MNMRILHVIFSMLCGGSELMLVDILRQQRRLGADVGLLIINDYCDGEILSQIPADIPVIRTDRPEGSINPWWIYKFNRQVRRFRPDVVHFHTSNAADLLVGMAGTPKVFTAHSMGLLLKNPARYAEIYAISDAVNRDLAERLGVKPVTILNGIDFSRIKVRKDAPSPVFRILTVGRLRHKVKGQHVLIEAVRMLKDRGVEVELDIIGEGPSHDYLSQLIVDKGLGDRIRLLGLRSREYVYGHIADYDLFVLPSVQEGFGLALVEAMGARVPVVATDISGPSEIIGNNEYGVLFPVNDSLALADVIAGFALPGSEYKAVVDKAYSHALNEYGIEKTAHAYLERYEALLSDRRK